MISHSLGQVNKQTEAQDTPKYRYMASSCIRALTIDVYTEDNIRVEVGQVPQAVAIDAHHSRPTPFTESSCNLSSIKQGQLVETVSIIVSSSTTAVCQVSRASDPGHYSFAEDAVMKMVRGIWQRGQGG